MNACQRSLHLHSLPHEGGIIHSYKQIIVTKVAVNELVVAYKEQATWRAARMRGARPRATEGPIYKPTAEGEDERRSRLFSLCFLTWQ